MATYNQATSQREIQEQKYKSARTNLLVAIVFTVLNIVLFFTGSQTMLLFSMSVPYFAVVFGVLLELPFLMTAGCAIAVIVIAVYFVCWLLSKKHYGG